MRSGPRHLPPHGLATLDGVSPSCVSLPAGGWATMTDFLVERFPAVSRETWLARMREQSVKDEHGAPVTPERPYQCSLRLYYYRAPLVEPSVPFEARVLFQDEHIVVADKPHFLPVTPSGPFLQQTLLVRLKKSLGIDTLSPLHRIDRETAGLVLFAVQPHERGAYQRLFRDREVSKRYEAIAPWRESLAFPLVRKSRIVEDTPFFFRQREAMGTANSETQLDVMEVRGDQARYALRPVTGKKHQLRVHMNALGLPIANDRIYPPVEFRADDDLSRPLKLLAQSISWRDPFTQEQRFFESRLRLDFD